MMNIQILHESEVVVHLMNYIYHQFYENIIIYLIRDIGIGTTW